MSTTLIPNTVSLANAVEFIKGTIEKVGLEFIAPLDPAVQNEKISKALSSRVVKEAGNDQ
ncbi:hypothetical protein D3C81_287980 [compost metagenome]